MAFLVGLFELEAVGTVECDGLTKDFSVRNVAQAIGFDEFGAFTLVRLPPMEAIAQDAAAGDHDREMCVS